MEVKVANEQSEGHYVTGSLEDEEFMAEFLEAVRSLRTIQNLTIAVLAAKCDVPTASITKLATKPLAIKHEVCSRILSALGYEADGRSLEERMRTAIADVPRENWLPDDKKWVWIPDVTVLEKLGYRDQVSRPIPVSDRDKQRRQMKTGQVEFRAWTIRPGDPLLQALDRAITRLLADPDRLVRLPALQGKGRSQPWSQAGEHRIGDLMGMFRFQADRVQIDSYSPTVGNQDEQEGAGRSRRKERATREIVTQYFCDPRVISEGILTREMIERELAVIMQQQDGSTGRPTPQLPPSESFASRQEARMATDGISLRR